MSSKFIGRNRLWFIGIALGMLLMLAAAACATAQEPQVVEVTKIVEVPVEVPVEVVREVPVEVIKEVPVEVIKEVPVEVTRTVEEEMEVAPPPDSRETIIFSDLSWTSAQVQNRIAQFIVEKGYGYPTDAIFGDTLPLFQGLRRGDTNVTMEIWLPNQDASWEEALSEGEVVSIGKSLGNDWQSTFVIPAYMQDQYPELDHIEDLKDPQFQEVFATTESRGMARLVACVPGWSCEAVNDAQIEAYGLTDFLHVIKPGSQDAMFADITGAYEKQEPWLGYMWGTGDPALLLDLVRLEETPYSDECWFTTKACAFQDATILIAVDPGLPARAPEVVEFLKNWDFNIDVYKVLVRWMSANPDATIEEAALFWLNDSVDVWTDWVTPDAAEKVEAALSAGEEAEGWPTS
ncbi:MAG TPA: glycine betaine ABC transporter substrate-binding protein [Dehalococcoidia bacterium]|nr:glycine betaine ABC transporter substrate-binding protein [Dehalococcoidia bacterium]